MEEEANVVVVVAKDGDVPQPMPGLHEAAAAPFLMKTFEMVEDRSTDEIVSWSGAGNSFVVWDPQMLATSLLPKFFKHSNFSSFIRQLHTYGFRKIDPHRYEFAHVKFLARQKHLLKDIKTKRQRNTGQSSQQQGLKAGASNEGGACVETELEAEVEQLKRDWNILVSEVVSLKQQLQHSQAHIVELEAKLRVAEKRQHQTMAFLTRAIRVPTFVKQLALWGEQMLRLESIGEKRPLENPEASDSSTMEAEIENLLSIGHQVVGNLGRDMNESISNGNSC